MKVLGTRPGAEVLKKKWFSESYQQNKKQFSMGIQYQKKKKQPMQLQFEILPGSYSAFSSRCGELENMEPGTSWIGVD